MRRIYAILDERGIASSLDLASLDQETEIEFVKSFINLWQLDLVDSMRRSTLRKFAVYVDAAVTDVVASQAAMYSDFSFYVTQAVGTMPLSMEADPLATGENLKWLPANAHDWIRLKKYRVPRTLVETLIAVKGAVLSGSALVLPTWVDAFGVSGDKLTFAWSVVRDHSIIDVNLTRFQEITPLLYGGKAPTGFVQLKVPALVGVPLETVLKIRQDEEEAFVRFTRRFFRMVKDNEDSLESERALAESITEVDDAVAQLEAEFQRIRRTRALATFDAGVKMVVCCLCLIIPSEVGRFLAGLFGGQAGTGMLKSFGEYRNDMSAFKRNDFYVPWLVSREARR